MTGNFKPYPEYKDSGLPWLDKIPKHWAVQRIKYLMHERHDRSTIGSEQLLSVSQYTGVTKRKGDPLLHELDSRAGSLIGYKLVAPGDLVVNIMLAWNGSMGISPYYGVASPAYCVYQFRSGLQPWYFHYLLRSLVYKARIKTASTGVVESRLRLYTDHLYQLEALVPPIDEQTAIVRFLDHVDRRVKRYIRAKQKMIKLLNEQKQTIIYHAVTRGIDDKVRLKSSGVEWFEEIPHHWKIIKICRIAHVVRGQTPRPAGDPRYFNGDGLPWITVGEVTKDKNMLLLETKTNLTWEGVKESKVFKNGTFVITNSGATLGVPKILAVDACMNDGVAALMNINKGVSKFFLYYYFQMMTQHLREITKIGGQPNLNTQIISNLLFPWPSLSEQEGIVNFLKEELQCYDQFIKLMLEQIQKMQEYRNNLITEVITGKIDIFKVFTDFSTEAEDKELLEADEEMYDIDLNTESVFEGEESEHED